MAKYPVAKVKFHEKRNFGKIQGKLRHGNEGDVKELPLTDQIERHLENDPELELVEVVEGDYDASEYQTSQSSAEQDKVNARQSQRESGDDEKLTSMGDEEAEEDSSGDEDESDAEVDSDYLDRLTGVNQVGQKTAESITELYPTAEELSQALEDGDTDFADDVEENLKEEFLQ